MIIFFYDCDNDNPVHLNRIKHARTAAVTVANVLQTRFISSQGESTWQDTEIYFTVLLIAADRFHLLELQHRDKQ